MKTQNTLITLLITALLILGTNKIKAQDSSTYGILSFNKAVNVSGKQRMLGQRIAKSYVYLANNSTDAKAKRDLLTSKLIFEKQNSILLTNSKLKSTKDALVEVNTIWKDLKKIIESTPTLDNAKKIIDINSKLLAASNKVVDAIINESKMAKANSGSLDDDFADEDSELKNIINIAGKQRMLSQRLALYYFANNSKLKSPQSERVLNNVYYELESSIGVLLVSDYNNSKIDEKLGEAMVKWSSILNRKAELLSQGIDAKEMYQISNQITAAFNSVTIAYEKVKL